MNEFFNASGRYIQLIIADNMAKIKADFGFIIFRSKLQNVRK